MLSLFSKASPTHNNEATVVQNSILLLQLLKQKAERAQGLSDTGNRYAEEYLTTNKAIVQRKETGLSQEAFGSAGEMINLARTLACDAGGQNYNNQLELFSYSPPNEIIVEAMYADNNIEVKEKKLMRESLPAAILSFPFDELISKLLQTLISIFNMQLENEDPGRLIHYCHSFEEKNALYYVLSRLDDALKILNSSFSIDIKFSWKENPDKGDRVWISFNEDKFNHAKKILGSEYLQEEFKQSGHGLMQP